MDQVYMNVPAVRQMTKNFQQIGEALDGVALQLETVIAILGDTASAFSEMDGRTVDSGQDIKPYVKQMADKCKEMQRDLDKSVDAYERGDALGATRFY
jgi:division protein CdvB (Snf7/Vps24/ESCRT-III family)